MSSLVVGSTMSVRGHSCVQRALIGTTPSEFLSIYCHRVADHTASRTRAKLVNGEIQVAGDQWPVFLYADYSYDAEDPWNGLLRSGLLVAVRSPFFSVSFLTIFTRHLNTPLRLRALLTRSQRLLALVMHVFMGCGP